MRWKAELSPKLGARRVVRRFLWTPTYLDGEWRWLERASINQIFAETVRNFGAGPMHVALWLDHSWTDDKKKTKKQRHVG